MRRSVSLVVLGLIASVSAAGDLIHDEEALRLAIKKWPLRDGAGVVRISDHFCDFVMADADNFLRVMSEHPDTFAEWLDVLHKSFTDFGGCCDADCLTCRKEVMVFALHRLDAGASYGELLEQLLARLAEIEIDMIE